MMRKPPLLLIFGAVAALLLSGCAGAGRGTARPSGSQAAGMKANGYYKVGEPYQIAGVWYYPKVDYDYDETGIASWYGEQFHAKQTANGEIFDMNEVSAAHKTLPLPSLVRVTNLENGRSMVIRVNDRGPFAPGRIIDLSRRSAQLLGTDRSGLARVRVQILGDESRAIADAMTRGRPEPVMVASAAAASTASDAVPVQVRPDVPNAAPRASVAVQALPLPASGSAATPAPPVAVAPAPSGVMAEASAGAVARQVAALTPPQPNVTTVPVVPTEIYVQAGAFQNVQNAIRLSGQLATIGRATVSPKPIRGQTLYRVRFGPFLTVDEADQTLNRVIQAGFADARVIVDQ
jgi:rare lipoprotein A